MKIIPRKSSIALIMMIMILPLVSFGQELYVNPVTGINGAPGTEPEPIATIGEGIGRLTPHGGTLFLEGEFSEKLSVGKATYVNKLIVDGQNKTIFRPPATVGISDAKNVTYKNFKVYGMIDLNNSYTEYGLGDITLKNLTVLQFGSRGIFLGAYGATNIKIIGCDILYGKGHGVTHAIYMSGGHWKPEHWVKGLIIRNCRVGYTAQGRNGIQLNGRFEDVLVEGNLLPHAQMNGITFIGVKNGIIRNNQSYGHNRGSFYVDYVYAHSWASQYNYFQTPADIAKFNATHWPNQNILVENNSIVVGPKAFSIDAYHYDDPTKNHGAILINNGIHSGFQYWYKVEGMPGEHRWHEGWPFPSKNLFIKNNIIHTPNAKIIDIYHEHEATETSLTGNMIWSMHSGGIFDLYIPFIKSLKQNSGNFNEDPNFEGPPEYQFIDLRIQPDYDWADHFSRVNLFSMPGKRLKKGAKFPVVVLGPGQDIDVK